MAAVLSCSVNSRTVRGVTSERRRSSEAGQGVGIKAAARVKGLSNIRLQAEDIGHLMFRLEPVITKGGGRGTKPAGRYESAVGHHPG